MDFANFLTVQLLVWSPLSLFSSLSVKPLLRCWPSLIFPSFFLFHLWGIFHMAMVNNKAGLSNTVKVQYGRRNNRKPKDDLLRVNKSAQQVEKDRRKRRDYASGKLYLIRCVLR